MSLQTVSYIAVLAASVGFFIYEYFKNQERPQGYRNANAYRAPTYEDISVPVAPEQKKQVRKRKVNKTESCSICLEDLAEEVIITLGCLHNFHYSCIKQCKVNNGCPLCRKQYKL